VGGAVSVRSRDPPRHDQGPAGDQSALHAGRGQKLGRSDRPTTLAWAVEDRFFKISFAERLAKAIPGAKLERIDDSYTFVPEDQPERLAALIGA
jgi:pimeloyl-ACP methyl ester carboxylesterase